jgi:hypothetical protein
MITFTWNSAFEAVPTSGLNRNALDNALKKIPQGIRERMELEHNWGPYADADDGKHSPGLVTVCDKGDADARDALSNVKKGSLFLVEDTGVLQLYVCTNEVGPVWTKATDMDHATLAGLTDDDHEQYVLAAGDEMSDPLDMNGNKITTSTAHDQGLVAYQHVSEGHSSIGNVAAIADDNILLSHFKLGTYEYTGTLAAGAEDTISLGSTTYVYFFAPNLYHTPGNGGAPCVWLAFAFSIGLWGWEVRNNPLGPSQTYRLKGAYISST